MCFFRSQKTIISVVSADTSVADMSKISFGGKVAQKFAKTSKRAATPIGPMDAAERSRNTSDLLLSRNAASACAPAFVRRGGRCQERVHKYEDLYQ